MINNIFKKIKRVVKKIYIFLKYLLSIPRCSGVNQMKVIINVLKLRMNKKEVVKKKILGNFMYLDLKTPGISSTLFIYGKREIIETDLLLDELSGCRNIIDIGANIGYYALLEASRTSAKIYAFEPDRRNIDILKKNIELNNFQKQIEVFPFSVGDKSGEKMFYMSKESNLSSFINNKKVIKSMMVKQAAIDDFEELRDIEIDLIRMDVEGYECQVISGMKKLLIRRKKLKLLIEVHPYAYNDEYNFIERLLFLDKFGYRVKRLVSAGIKLPKEIQAFYSPLRVAQDTCFTRGLYSDISMKHLISFLNNKEKIVRAILLEKNEFKKEQ